MSSTLTGSYIEVRYPFVEKDALERIADNGYDTARRIAFELFPIKDLELSVRIEEGSLINRTRIAVAAGALYIAIGQFGSFVQGVKEIAAISRAAADSINREFARAVGSENAVLRTRRDTGLAGKLERLFIDVKSGRLTPTEATEKALGLVDRTGNESSPELNRALRKSILQIEPVVLPRSQQLQFGTHHGEHFKLLEPPEKQPRPPHKPAPQRKPPLAVEVWSAPGGRRKKRRSWL